MIYEDENGKAGILRVDVNTGEILQHYAAVYETRPYGTPSTAKEREHYRATSKCPASARRADEVEDYVKHTTDGRVPMAESGLAAGAGRARMGARRIAHA